MKKRLNKMGNIEKTTEITIDSETGEVIEGETIERIPIGREPTYFKVYIDDLSKLMGLNDNENLFFYSLARNMSFNNSVVLVKRNKEHIVKETKLSMKTIEKYIKRFVDKKILIREDRACYIVNPAYCAKGEWADIKSLRIEISYSSMGRQVRVVKNKDSLVVSELLQSKRMDYAKILSEDDESQ